MRVVQPEHGANQHLVHYLMPDQQDRFSGVRQNDLFQSSDDALAHDGERLALRRVRQMRLGVPNGVHLRVALASFLEREGGPAAPVDVQ